MNRLSALSLKIAAAALALAVLAAVPAEARIKKPAHKKKEDLSANPLAGVNSKQPDKELFDKAMAAMKKSRYDVSRLDLQTLLNTYPDSEYRMRAKLAVGDIYYQQMEKPDRDYDNAQNAEREYRNMLNQYPDSTLVPRAKQKLRETQEVLAERETQIGLYYESRENYVAAIARLETVVDTFPLYSRSDQALLGIGDAYMGQVHNVQVAPGLPGAIKERLRAVYQDRAAAAYTKVITRYPMAPHVEDARDRLVAMNRPVPEPTREAIAESEAEEQSREPVRLTTKSFDLIRRGPTVVQAVHVGEPSVDDPKRTLAPDITKENLALFNAAVNAGRPAAAPTGALAPTGPNEPPRSDQPSSAPLQLEAPAGGTGVGVQIVSAPTAQAVDPNAVIKPVGPANTVIPAAEKPAEAPNQVNEIKPAAATATTLTDDKSKKPKADLSDESSSKKKKKKGLGKLNPF